MARRIVTLFVVSAGLGIGGCGDDIRVVKPEAEAGRAPAATAAKLRDGAVANEAMTVSAKPEAKEGGLGFRVGALDDSVSPRRTTMIIRTGQVSIQVDSLDTAIAVVSRLAAEAGGYLANTAIQTGTNQPRTATLEIKVPADRYDRAVEGLRRVGKLLTAVTSAQDVGEEYVDVAARMSNARRLEERLITLLATRTGKLDDVLSVERELARVREEIERYEGRLRFLKTQTAMSTLTVTISEPLPIVGQPGSNPIVEAVKQAWRNGVRVVAGGIEVAGGLIPLALLAGLGGLVARKVWRKKEGLGLRA